MDRILYSRKSDEWETPQNLFNDLHNEFNFTLDAAASDELHKCPKYYTASDDGLAQSWEHERVFVNPPYSKIATWVKKMLYGTQKARRAHCFINAGKDRHTIFSRLYLPQGRNKIYKGAPALFKRIGKCAISVDDCYFRRVST